MIELSHYAGLAQEVPPLFLGVAYFQRFNSHGDVPLSRQLEPSAAHLSELSCDAHNHPQAESQISPPTLTPLPVPSYLTRISQAGGGTRHYMMLCVGTQGSATERAHNWICYIEDTLTYLYGL